MQIMFAPKNLLRHPLAKSPLAEFSETASDKDPNIQVSWGCFACRAGVVSCGRVRPEPSDKVPTTLKHPAHLCLQGVRFKRVIMDESSTSLQP